MCFWGFREEYSLKKSTRSNSVDFEGLFKGHNALKNEYLSSYNIYYSIICNYGIYLFVS